MKILFLVNGKIKADNTCEGTPVMMRTIRNSPTPIPVFDIATYYTFTQFNAAERPKHFAWTFTSQDGKIDDAMQLFPFDPTTNNSDPSFDTNHKYWKKKVDTTITNHVVTVAHWYNAFREGAEWAGARADDDTAEIQLIADFTLVITEPGKENLLFRKKPRGILVNGLTRIETPISETREYSNARIFRNPCLWIQMNSYTNPDGPANHTGSNKVLCIQG